MKSTIRILTVAIVAALAVLAVPACSHIPGLRGLAAPSPFDTVTYQVIGDRPGNVSIVYTNPTGVVTVVASTMPPWQSGPVAGYGEFHTQHASITVTLIGCATVQVLVNAKVEAENKGCGVGFPVAVTASK